ncbi:MAG: DNA-3-methyladenine glycosylase I [Marinomonas sp.]
MTDPFIGPDGKARCAWAGTAPEFLAYHDKEWGFPVVDDQRLFEKVCLESFQSGLSWRTILNKRAAFRAAFDQFDFHKVALYQEAYVEKLLQNEGIIRNRRKIEAVINNAQKAIEMQQEEGSLAAFFWRYEAKAPAEPQRQTTSEESIALSKALKKKGWKFVGPTTMFAFLQSMGFINDHEYGCCVREEIEIIRKQLKRP